LYVAKSLKQHCSCLFYIYFHISFWWNTRRAVIGRHFKRISLVDPIVTHGYLNEKTNKLTPLLTCMYKYTCNLLISNVACHFSYICTPKP